MSCTCIKNEFGCDYCQFLTFKKMKEDKVAPNVQKPVLDTFDLLWNNFWGEYDGLMEWAYMRQSIHTDATDAEIVESMFIKNLNNLSNTAAKLAADLEDLANYDPNGFVPVGEPEHPDRNDF